MYREFPESVFIPINTDILYIGLSSWGIDQNDIGRPDLAYYTKLTDSNYTHLVKIYNMLSTHGLLICSLKGLFTLQKCIL